MKQYLLLLLFIISSGSNAAILPIIQSFEGVGSVYGVAYQDRFERSEILLGVGTGAGNAAGGLYSYYLTPNLKLSLAGGVVDDLVYETTYLRGLQNDEDNVYLQNIDLSGALLSARYSFLNSLFALKLSTGQTTVKINSYEDDEGEVELPGVNLFDIETSIVSTGLEFNLRTQENFTLLHLGVDRSMMTGRTGQSDHTIDNYKAVLGIPITPIIILRFKHTQSKAAAAKTKYDNDTEIRDAFNVDCSTLSTTTDQARCQALEDQLVAYVLANNLYGSANALGGSASLRSFREQRFKAANTALNSTELAIRISELFGFSNKERSLDFVTFYDVGYASDSLSKLWDKSYYSKGLGLNYNLNSISLRFQMAQGSLDSSAWFFGIGSGF